MTISKIIIKDMQIRVRKESDNSEGWIKMNDLVDTIVDCIIKEK